MQASVTDGPYLGKPILILGPLCFSLYRADLMCSSSRAD
jgi:hypothetical protein